ncbi:MAG: hypothetical protein ACTSO4_17240 [Promethearchaeota archaeon]
MVINLEKHKTTKKKTLFNIFILTMIEIICGNIYLILCAISGTYTWTPELFTSTIAGMIVQIVMLISIIIALIVMLISIIIAFILIVEVIILFLLLITRQE